VPGSSPEQDRLKRLRDRQLAARDPQAKRNKLYKGIAARHRRAAQPFSIGRMWSEIPHRWRGVLYGLLLGTAAFIAVPIFWHSPWAAPCSGVSIPALGVLGFLLGRALDARDSLNELLR
jgi:hypothetical protein